MTPFDISVFKSPEPNTKTLTIQKVWVANPNIDRRDYPGVNWDDIAAIEKDPRFGSFVSVPTFGNSEYVAGALAAGTESVNDIFSLPAHVVIGASLGIFALLLL